MILVFGGTTEGRKAVAELEEAGSPFFYSTKTGEQDIALHHGIRVDGAMDEESMVQFCHAQHIRLLVDAAHPFAAVLHGTVAKVAERLSLPTIRFERIFPERDKDIVWLEGYADAVNCIKEKTLLVTTGVQSIARLKPLEAKGATLFYRILNRESSIACAQKQGATTAQLCYYESAQDIPVKADAILLKESGETGGFVEKVKAARERGMTIYALKRPPTPQGFHCVNGPHGLRRLVERFLPEFYPLHSGLTTGTCATAAAIAATLRLLKGQTPPEVPVILPNGETIHVAVGYADGYAFCIKEAGDDPDVTDGIEIRAEARPLAPSLAHQGEETVALTAGAGVGRFTLPGFDYPPGEPAINKAPRQMLKRNIEKLLPAASKPKVRITLSIPQGEAIARKTFNPRLGIEGGLSIIGVSGIVKPFSEEAFIESIRKCMTVAQASGTERIVIHSGAKSEATLRQHYPHLPLQAFVEYGNAIGATLQIANNLQVSRLTLGIMLGKAVKLAEGHLDTHSKKVVMNKAFIISMLQESACDDETQAKVQHLTLARELWNLIPTEQIDRFCHTVIQHCLSHCQPLLPKTELTILLIDDGGKLHSL